MTQREAPLKRGRSSLPLPWLTGLLLLLSDFLALGLSFLLALAFRAYTGGEIAPGLYLRLLPVLAVFPILYRVFGLYPALGLHPALELQRLWTATALGFLLLGAGAFLSKTGPLYSRFSFLVAFLLALLLVPLLRAGLRHLFSSRDWWGGGLHVEGDGEALRNALEGARRLGLKPAPLGPWTYGVLVEGVPDTRALPPFPRVFLPFQGGLRWRGGGPLG